MSALSCLLTLSTPASQTDEQTAATNALKNVNEEIDAELMAIPDPKEELWEEQEYWVEKWDVLMDRSVDCLTEAGRVGVEPRLKTGLAERMQDVEKFAKVWRDAAKQRTAERLERERANAARQLQQEQAERDAAEKALQLAEEKEAREAREGASGSSQNHSPFPSSDSSSMSPKEMLHMQPKVRMTALPFCRIPVAPAPAPSKGTGPEPPKTAPAPAPAVGPSNNAPTDRIVIHRVPCDKCKTKGEECRGYPDRTCERCAQLKAQCNKSLGRGKAKAAVEEEKGSKAKGKGPVRPARMANRKPFPNPPKRKTVSKVISLDSSSDEDAEGEDDDEEEEPARPRKKAKTSHPEPGAEDMRVAGVLALKRLKGKILTMQGRIKSAEAELGTMGIEMGKLVREFADVEAALGM